MTEQIKPPFNHEAALLKVQRAEDLWNTRNPERVSLAYSENTAWRNRSEVAQGRDPQVDQRAGLPVAQATVRILGQSYRGEFHLRVSR